MKNNISKSLAAIVARATFSTMKHGVKRNLLDHLFLEMITFENSVAFEALSSLMESWRLYKLRQGVEQSHTQADEVEQGIRPELFYASVLSDISESYPTSEKITSLHALHYISTDMTTATAKCMEELGVTPQHIEQLLVRYATSSEIKAAHNQLAPIHIGSTKDSRKEERPHPLSKFGVDMTHLASEGKIDPVVGREKEIERVVQILSRRKKNNPILVGEAGVGKSAIVEGLALRMNSGDVPHTISGRRLFSLDLSSLVAGTKFRGEFEERMKQLLSALRQADDSIVFIDEIHIIVGAGSSQGSLDIANILKPALSRGELQTIGATTLDEYRRDIESDAALVRRFQRVLVEPTTCEQSLEILRNIAPNYESHHRVKYTAEALEACVSLSNRYITTNQLPDKAIDLMDEAGALFRTTHTEGSRVEVEDVERVVTMITGVPAERLSQGENIRLRALAQHLHSRVVGQQRAVESVARTIKRSRAGVRDENRPIGTFLFVGPTGVGKTLLAKELSKWLFEGNESLLRIDMSEYSLSHSVARLIGSPPGYVGYGEGGELTEPVRREPYSVVLLDEIEKAHPDIYNLLLQLLDEGHLTDGAGRRVDFRNTIVIMTSNVGSRKIADAPPQIGYVAQSGSVKSRGRLYEESIRQSFPPEFLNRIDDTIIFSELQATDMEQIVSLELETIFERVQRLGYNIRITPSARREIAAVSFDKRYGARSLRRTLVELLEEPIANMIIEEEVQRGDTIIIEKSRTQGENIRLKA